MTARPGLLVWWLSQQCCEQIGEKLLRSYPVYLRKQYRSRLGRAGRGRLWVDDQFGEVSIDPWPDTSLSRELGQRYGGIVIRAEDLTLVALLPGIVTDLSLAPVASALQEGT